MYVKEKVPKLLQTNLKVSRPDCRAIALTKGLPQAGPSKYAHCLHTPALPGRPSPLPLLSFRVTSGGKKTSEKGFTTERTSGFVARCKPFVLKKKRF